VNGKSVHSKQNNCSTLALHAMAATTTQQTEFQKNFRLIVEKIFNNWQNLRLAVEHGMGGRNGQQVRLCSFHINYNF